MEKTLERFSMQNSEPVSTLLTHHFKLSIYLYPITDEKTEDMFQVSYASVVRSLMYVMVCNRPDLSHVVSLVSKYMDNPIREHWNVVK